MDQIGGRTNCQRGASGSECGREGLARYSAAGSCATKLSRRYDAGCPDLVNDYDWLLGPGGALKRIRRAGLVTQVQVGHEPAANSRDVTLIEMYGEFSADHGQ